ncbi:MAG: thermonuclease family protein [Bacteroidota bacterium]
MKDFQLYQYQGLVTEVYDGDTCTITFDLGFKISFTEKVRLLGINAPEMRGNDKAKGTISRDRLREKILNQTICIETQKDEKEKYGRYLGIIYLKNSKGELENVNNWMVNEGLALKASY